MKKFFKLLIRTVKGWLEDKAPKQAAALAYYTIFSIAPLIIIVITILGFLYKDQDFGSLFMTQVSSLVGETGAAAFEGVVEAANKPEASVWATVISIVTLLFGATGVFVQLKEALNVAWGVEKQEGEGIKGIVRVRAIAIAGVLVIGFLLLVSLFVSAFISGITSRFSSDILILSILIQILNQVVAIGFVSVLFAFIFKFLPDVHVAWKDVWIGAIFTSILFNIGKYLIGIYLGNSNVGSVFGAAGSILVVLVWVYYSAQILLFGAEFTQVYSEHFGSMKKQKVKLDSSSVSSEAQVNVKRKFDNARSSNSVDEGLAMKHKREKARYKRLSQRERSDL